MDTIVFNGNTISNIQLARGIAGVGGVTVASGKVTFWHNQDTYVYTGETRIEAGANLETGRQPNTMLTSPSIVVNGLWDFSARSTDYNLKDGQTLSGTGTVKTQSQTRNFTVPSGATVAPGDDGIGTLTIDGRLVLDGGTFEFEIGEAAGDRIDSLRLRVSGTSPTTIQILDADRKTPGTVTLFEYASDVLDFTNDGAFSDLALVLPDGWSGELVNNTANKSIDLNITQLPPRGTVLILK